MPFVANEVKIIEPVRKILEKISESRTKPFSMVQRSQIILMASEGYNNREIGDNVLLSQDVASKWRNRYNSEREYIERIAENHPEGLESSIETLLKDKPRPGAPCDFTEVQILQILELACSNPRDHGYETSHWSNSQLATAAVKAEIVESISSSSVNRFLKYGSNPTTQSAVLAALYGKSRRT
jgi:transposase